MTVDSEFKNLIPPLSPEERQGLDDFRLLSKYCRVDFVELVNGKLRLKGD